MEQFVHTFIICAYQDSPYLSQCIESCKQQLSVIEGRSQICLYTSTPTKTIHSLCEQFDIPLFTCDGGGIGKDWNNALSFVQTPYATIVHQDDIYEEHYGTEVLETFHRYQDCNIVFTDYSEIDKQGTFRKRNINLHIKTFGLHILSWLPFKWYQKRVYAFGNFICCPAVSYNLERLNDFHFNENLKMTLDWDAWERIMKKKGRIKYIAKKLMYHRIHEDSETTNNTVDRTREAEEQMIFERYWGKRFSKIIMKLYVLNQKSNDL